VSFFSVLFSVVFLAQLQDMSESLLKLEPDSVSDKPGESTPGQLSLLKMLSHLSSSFLGGEDRTATANVKNVEPSPVVNVPVTPEAPAAAQTEEQPPAAPKTPTKSHYSGRHGNWTPEEDELLLKLVAKYDTARTKQWTYIAKMMGTGRIGKQCRDRYLNHTGPDVVKTPWTPEEDRIIILSQKLYGNSWTRIAKILGNGRPANGIKNRWNSCLRHRYLEIDGESLDVALAKGHLNSNGVITVQKARKRPSDAVTSNETSPKRMKKASTAVTSGINGGVCAADGSNGTVSQTTSSPESPKVPSSPVMNTTSPLPTIPQSLFPQSMWTPIPGSGVPPANMLWPAIYPTMCAPMCPTAMGAFAAVSPNFVSIRPAAMMMNPSLLPPNPAFLPMLLQQQPQQAQQSISPSLQGLASAATGESGSN